jgi:predicted RNA-binding Zn-ribbon protein involved in translation (DUF1610 family)
MAKTKKKEEIKDINPTLVLIEKCIRCKKKINKQVNLNDTMFVCPKCGVFVANQLYGGRKNG